MHTFIAPSSHVIGAEDGPRRLPNSRIRFKSYTQLSYRIEQVTTQLDRIPE